MALMIAGDPAIIQWTPWFVSENNEVIPEREREVSEKEVYAGIPGTGGEAGLGWP